MSRTSSQRPLSGRERATRPKSGATTQNKPPSASESKSEPRVRSVLIEPRDNEPPRVSVSVEYESEAPSLKALQKAAMETIHDVVKGEPTLVDLGYREQQQSRLLTQTFEAREKESK